MVYLGPSPVYFPLDYLAFDLMAKYLGHFEKERYLKL